MLSSLSSQDKCPTTAIATHSSTIDLKVHTPLLHQQTESCGDHCRWPSGESRCWLGIADDYIQWWLWMCGPCEARSRTLHLWCWNVPRCECRLTSPSHSVSGSSCQIPLRKDGTWKMESFQLTTVGQIRNAMMVI